MTDTRRNSLQEVAARLLDTLAKGREVTLEITARDAETGGLLLLITEIHEAARARRMGVHLTPLGERGMRLALTEPAGGET